MIFDRFDWIGQVKPIMLGLPYLNECNQHVESVALRRIALGAHETFDLLKGASVIAYVLDRFDFHRRSPSDRLRVDMIILPVRAHEPDVNDTIGIVDP